MSIRKTTFAAVLTALLTLTPRVADAVPITDLFEGATLTAADKLFDDWSLLDVQTVNGASAVLSAVDVTPLTDDPLNPGVKFTTDGLALGTPFGHQGPSSASVRFSYSVQTISGEPLIKDNSLFLNGFTFDAGPQATITISETVTDALGAVLGTKVVFANSFDSPGSGDPDHFDFAEFDPRDIVFVETFVDIQGPGTNDGAVLAGFEQRFSQVPEPAAGLLAFLGLPLLRRARGRGA